MELMIVIAAAILAWVIGAIIYRLADGVYASASALQVRNIGDPRDRPATPYLLAGVGLVAVSAMIRVLFLRAGIDGMVTGAGWGALIGAALVSPWLVIENTHASRPMLTTLIDAGFAVAACAAIGAVMGAV